MSRQESESDHPTKRVLVVNPFDDGCAMYVAFLRHFGIDARAASRPEAALHALRAFGPSVIVTDFVFPGSRYDGVRLAKEIRCRPESSSVTIIMVSGFVRPIDERRARDAGVDHFLRKPCLPERLLREVRRALTVSHADGAHVS